MAFIRLAALVIPIAATVACAYRPGLSENPITRSASWFSYVGAEDIKESCAEGSPARYRIIYNGTAETERYEGAPATYASADPQVRAYDITTAPPGPGARMRAQYRGETDVSKAIPLGDLLAPWRPTFEAKDLSAAQLSSVRAALRESGFYSDPPDGVRLESWGFFWIAAACENGKFTYNGWGYGSPRFERAHSHLAPAMARLDPIEKPFTKPRQTFAPERDERGNREGYQLYVTPAGTKGHITLF